MRPITTSDAVWIESDNEFRTFKVRIRYPKDRHIATFPFAGTLEQAQAEAARLASCFTFDVYTRLSLWFEE